MAQEQEFVSLCHTAGRSMRTPLSLRKAGMHKSQPAYSTSSMPTDDGNDTSTQQQPWQCIDSKMWCWTTNTNHIKRHNVQKVRISQAAVYRACNGTSSVHTTHTPNTQNGQRLGIHSFNKSTYINYYTVQIVPRKKKKKGLTKVLGKWQNQSVQDECMLCSSA